MQNSVVWPESQQPPKNSNRALPENKKSIRYPSHTLCTEKLRFIYIWFSVYHINFTRSSCHNTYRQYDEDRPFLILTFILFRRRSVRRLAVYISACTVLLLFIAAIVTFVLVTTLRVYPRYNFHLFSLNLSCDLETTATASTLMTTTTETSMFTLSFY
jgi:hypothetical protein